MPSRHEVAVLYANGLLAAASIGILASNQPAISAEFRIGPVAASAMMSMFSLCGALCGAAVGAWLARADLRWAVQSGSAALAVSSVGSALAHSFAAFFAFRALASLGFIVLATVIPIAFSRYPERVRVVALALWGAYLPAGIALGNALGAAAFHGAATLKRAPDAGAWRATFAIHGCCMLAAAGLMARRQRWMGLAPSRQHAATQPLRIGVQVAALNLSYAAGFGAFSAMFLVIAGILPKLLSEAGGLAPMRASLTASFVLAGGALGSLAAVRVLRRTRSAQAVFGGAFVGSAVFAFGLYAVATTPLAIAACALAIIVISGLIPAAVFAYLPRIAGDEQRVGVVNGLLTQVGCLGALLGPPLAQWWIERFGYTTGWVPLTLVCTAGCLFFVPAVRMLKAM